MNLILGTANFNRPYGKFLDTDECFKLLDRAKALGIKTLATAFDYGSEIAAEYGWKDIVHKYEPMKIRWNGLEGISLDKLPIDGFSGDLLMAPFNPLNYSFRPLVAAPFFIARSIFYGGRFQRTNKEDVARMIFGFLKSHEVKNCVFGVESIEELEVNVEAANGPL